MTGNEFITVAGKIAATYSDAASCRTAVGRAYYGAFHVAREFLAELEVSVPKNVNTHVFIQHRLAGSGHTAATQAAQLLRDLYKDRLDADYELNQLRVESVHCARACVERANRIQSLFQKCKNDLDRQKIKAGIAAYEAKASASS